MARISKDDVLKLARLSKLDLSEDQVEHFRKEMEEIMEYVEMLQKVYVSGEEPTYQVTGMTNVTRPDEVREYANQEELLKNLPDREKDYIKVNKMIG